MVNQMTVALLAQQWVLAPQEFRLYVLRLMQGAMCKERAAEIRSTFLMRQSAQAMIEATMGAHEKGQIDEALAAGSVAGASWTASSTTKQSQQPNLSDAFEVAIGLLDQLGTLSEHPDLFERLQTHLEQIGTELQEREIRSRARLRAEGASG